MKAGALCIRNVVTVTAREMVVEAARRMAEFRTGDLIIVEPRASGRPRPIAILTDRDLVVRVLACPERSPATTMVGEVMRAGVVTACEDEDIERIVAAMRDHGIRRIPIIDRHGGLCGILSLDDVLGWMREQIEAATQLLEAHGEKPRLDTPLQ
jgi:CBS domain-containing protein